MYDLSKVVFKKGMVIHCDTEEKAKALCLELHKNGFEWNSGESLESEVNYDGYKEKSCYLLQEHRKVMFGDSGATVKFDDLPNLKSNCDQTAKADCGITRKSVLEQAEKTVCVDREKQYGSPEDNFKIIAKLWSVVLGITITPKMVAIMMNLLKVARIISGQRRADNWVDSIGYMACGAELEGLE